MRDKPIHASSIKNQLQKLEEILKQGGDVDTLGEYHCTPLHYACREGHLDMVEFLIKNGADVNRENRYSTRYPIFDALISTNKKDSFSIIELLIDSGADINNIDSFGNTILHHATEQEDIALIELFVTRGCNINKTLRHDKDTALHYACFQKNREIISKLIESGANREFLNLYNKTPESYL